ncbi:MAG: ATP-binding protein [Terriglobia bacterium]
MQSDQPKRQKTVIILSAVVALLFVFAVLQQAINLTTYFDSPDHQTALLLWALMSLNVVLLTVCILILLRHLLKLYYERKSHQLGSKFRTKLVFAFLGLSLIPVMFMSFFAYFLLNRNLDKWFSTPIDQVVSNVDLIVRELNQDASNYAARVARFLANQPATHHLLAGSEKESHREIEELVSGMDISVLLIADADGSPIYLSQGNIPLAEQSPAYKKWVERLRALGWMQASGQLNPSFSPDPPAPKGAKSPILSTLDDEGQEVFLASAAVPPSSSGPSGVMIVGFRIQGPLLHLAGQVTRSGEEYRKRLKENKLVRFNFMLWLGLITLLVLFAAVWIGLYLSKKIAIPIRALAEAAKEVSTGNLLVQVNCPAEDELGILVDSFNQMTTQLHEGSQKLEQSYQELEAVNRVLEEKRRYTEAVLENIPTGVISVSPDYRISKINKAALTMLGCQPTIVSNQLQDIFHGKDFPEVLSILEKAKRTGLATRELRLQRPGRNLYCAVTISSLLDDGEFSEGYVMVLEDLTEVLKAQKANAWREVARRMAHEIKNPLTPIQLSADRLLKNYTKSSTDLLFPRRQTSSFGEVLQECVQTITQEVSTLKSMVDAFSRFARLPNAVMMPANINHLIENTLSSFNGRFDGIHLVTELSPDLPEVHGDPEQLRRVFVNLLDNALEALEDAPKKELAVSSSFSRKNETVQIIVKDSGHGISPADKEKLFLPYFSTRKRGTGLGLAIVSRIVADHKGYIHVEDNYPQGASFVLELPAR